MDVKLPDGTVIKDIPDGMSRADLTAKLAKNGYDVSKLGGAPAADPSMAGVPGYDSSGAPQVQKAPEQNPDGLLKRAAGAGEALLATGTGMLGGAAGAVAGIGKAALKKITTGQGSSDSEVDKTVSSVANALTYQPRTQTGANLTQLAGEVAAPLAAFPTAMMHNAAVASAPLAQLAGNAVKAGGAAAGAAAGDAAGGALSSLARGVVPKIDPRVAELAQKANDYNIPLRPDMLYKNKIAKIMGEASEKVPFSGSPADTRQTAFNKAIIGTIGGDNAGGKLTPDVFDKAITTSGQKIGDIAGRSPLAIDKDLTTAIEGHVQNAAKYETSDVAKVINSYVDELTSKADEGVVPGEAFRKLNTKINTQMRNTSNGDLKHALGALQDDLQDALQRNLSGDDLAELKVARRQYAIAKTIEPLVAKSATGDISPAGLMGRVTSNNAGKARMARGSGGDIGDLARIGQAFLKEPNSSGTAERAAAYGLISGGAFAEPVSTTAVLGAANLYNRTGGAIARKLVPLRTLSGGN